MSNALTDILRNPEWRARQRAAWEEAVRERPEVAYRVGPPNWMVLEIQKKDEDHEVASARLLAEYFPATMQPRATVFRAVATEAQPEEAVAEKRVCEDCGKSILSRTYCATCRSKRSRAKKK